MQIQLYKLNRRIYSLSENIKKKSLLYKRLVGIKNSWKYEKDLIIFKPYCIQDTITHLSTLDIEFKYFSDKLF